MLCTTQNKTRLAILKKTQQWRVYKNQSRPETSKKTKLPASCQTEAQWVPTGGLALVKNSKKHKRNKVQNQKAVRWKKKSVSRGTRCEQLNYRVEFNWKNFLQRSNDSNLRRYFPLSRPRDAPLSGSPSEQKSVACELQPERTTTLRSDQSTLIKVLLLMASYPGLCLSTGFW